MTPAIQPSQRTWTLRFKNHRCTILLHVDPLQKFSSIREELLKAVQQTHPDGTMNGARIPDSADEIRFAKPKDINDLTLGWDAVVGLGIEDALFEEGSKAKGKAAMGKSKSKSGTDETPQSLGLRDAGVLAFKFHDRHEEAEDELTEELALDDQSWDVVLPDIDELYGEERGEVDVAADASDMKDEGR